MCTTERKVEGGTQLRRILEVEHVYGSELERSVVLALDLFGEMKYLMGQSQLKNRYILV